MMFGFAKEGLFGTGVAIVLQINPWLLAALALASAIRASPRARTGIADLALALGGGLGRILTRGTTRWLLE